MRLLRVLDLAGVAPRRVRHVLGAVQVAGLLACRGDRRLRQVAAVGAHVGDVAVLVQPLGGLHGALRGEAQLAAGLLLQGAGHERRVGLAAVRLVLDGAHREGTAVQPGDQVAGAPLVHVDDVALEPAGVGVEVAAGGQALAVQGDQGRRQAARRRRVVGLRGRLEGALDVPVARLGEAHPGPLALHHDPRRHRLHAARGQPRHDLLPQHRADLVAVQPVQDPSGLLGLHQARVELARRLDRVLDGLRGDLVEDHPAHRDLGLQGLQQVPGDGLALAVLVGGEEQLVGLLEQRLELGDLRLALRRDDVERREPVVDVDAGLRPRQPLVAGRDVGGVARQVADVAVAALDDVAGSQEGGDLLGLGRRLDDDQPAPARARGGLLRGRPLLRGGSRGGGLGHGSPGAGGAGWAPPLCGALSNVAAGRARLTGRGTPARPAARPPAAPARRPRRR